MVTNILSFQRTAPSLAVSFPRFPAASNNDNDNMPTTIGLSKRKKKRKRINPDTNNYKPTNIHLALTGHASEMMLQFTTVASGTPVVRYAPFSTKHPYSSASGGGVPDTYKAEGTSTTYTANDLCGAPANRTDATGFFCDPGQLHSIVLTRLEPLQVYRYQMGVAFGQGIFWDDVIHKFANGPAVGSVDQPYSYLVYGDQACPTLGWGMGGAWTTMAVVRELQKPTVLVNNDNKNSSVVVPISAVHHIGGLSYARGAAHLWDEWLAMVQTFAARIPLMIAVGNYEYDYATQDPFQNHDPSGAAIPSAHSYRPRWGNYGSDSGGECGVPVSKRFVMPATGNGVFWYNYSSAMVHTIVLSSEHDLHWNSTQYRWFQATLAGVNRTLTPWVVVELHRPLYHNQQRWSDNSVGLGLRYNVESLLHQYSGNLVLSGHYRSYFRSCAGLYQSACHNGGPTHITVGSGGAMLDGMGYYGTNWADRTIREVYGYGRVTVVNATALHFEFVQAGPEDDNTTGTVLDHVWIYR
eukprot:Nitzschia sp. Nitz4//scaffold36_size144017//141374//142942//NITZ4_003121-RA/size144017-processed-gene-0.281-mRNA-1//-1//CDS//3329549561//2306//frame0